MKSCIMCEKWQFKEGHEYTRYTFIAFCDVPDLKLDEFWLYGDNDGEDMTQDWIEEISKAETCKYYKERETKRSKTMSKPSWTEYFINLAYHVSLRSSDESTKVGCVIVNKDHSILSTGYNSPPRGINDSKVPQTRPEKYDWMIHAEDNAIANAARVGVSTDGGTVYCTEYPCSRCMGVLINAGIKKVYFANKKAKINSGNSKPTEIMAKESGVKLTHYVYFPNKD